MDDLHEAVAEMFSTHDIWDSVEFAVWCEEAHRRKLEYMLQWCSDHMSRSSKKAAQRRYALRHPDRVKESQRKYAMRKWQRTKADPAKLAARRAYQAKWAKYKRQSKRRYE